MHTNPLKQNKEGEEDKLYDLQVHLFWKILCPNCKSDSYWRDGLDRRNHNLQRYRCSHCFRRFYAHTSYFPLSLRKLLVEQVLYFVIVCGMTLTLTAELLKISRSTVSRIICLSRQALNFQKERHRELLRKFKQLSPARQEVRYLDETFYKIAGKTVYLILLTDAVGRILAWELSQTRQSHDILRVLQSAEEKYPQWQTLVTDGAFTYRQAFLMLGKAGLLIQQVHSHPWDNVWLRLFIPLETGCQEAQLVLPYTTLQSKEPVPIAAAIQKHEQNLQVKRKQPLRRYHFSPECQSILPNKFVAVNPAFEFAISKVSAIFGKGSIQSNRIESVNSQVKRFSSTRGIKTLEQFKRRLRLLLAYISGFPPPQNKRFPLSSKQALKNATNLLPVDIKFSSK